MKRLTYLITLFGLLLASCTDEDTLGSPSTGNDDKTAFQFSVNMPEYLSLIHISEPTRQAEISYAVFCLKKKTTSAR